MEKKEKNNVLNLILKRNSFHANNLIKFVKRKKFENQKFEEKKI